MGSPDGVPAWLARQACCEPAPIPSDFQGTLLVLATSCSASDPVGHVRELRKAAPCARLRVVAEPRAARALAVLAAHGEDDWLPYGSDLVRELERPVLSAEVVSRAWGGMPPLELARAAGILARHGFALNAGEWAEELAAHERTLRRMVKAACGRSPKEIIMSGRHAIVRHVLACGLGPSHVAPVLGYATPASLAASFSRLEGSSPRRFILRQARPALEIERSP